MTLKPLCFVLMPFSKKKDPATGLDIDFDRIYETAIRPGIEKAAMEPIRADEERTGGIIHKPMLSGFYFVIMRSPISRRPMPTFFMSSAFVTPSGQRQLWRCSRVISNYPST